LSTRLLLRKSIGEGTALPTGGRVQTELFAVEPVCACVTGGPAPRAISNKMVHSQTVLDGNLNVSA